MTYEKLRKLLEDIRAVKVAIVGDFCLDAYWFIDDSKSEISIETGHATRPVFDQRYSLGGAGNVANNLSALCIKEIIVFGVIGNDPFGTEMTGIMNKAGINSDNLLVQENDWSTHTYAKPYIGDQELNRIDFGNFNNISESTADKLIANLGKIVPSADIVIINQQVPFGIHTDYFKKRLAELILSFPHKIFITDSRNFNDYYNGSIRKMNDNEALRLCGKIREPEDKISLTELEVAAGELFTRYKKPLFITRGSRGSITVENDGIRVSPGLSILSKVDAVGAGDSFLAGAASALAAGYNMSEAAELGTLVAGVTVQKLFQTGTASPEEILSIGRDPDYIFFPELAEDKRYAKYLDDTDIEIINIWKEKPRIKYAIFDHDGTISSLREGWEKIMIPVMIKAILGDYFLEADNSLIGKIKLRVSEYIDKTTGVQTLIQMHGLIDLIDEFGFVPKKNILDAKAYKQIYNEELLKMVGERVEKYNNGELSVEDLTIKGSIQFIKELFDAGVKLYLASGTDVEDVTREAEILGYAHYFKGGIFGSVGDINKDAKKIVLDQILDIIDDSSGKLITFGDGPVEIRETVKRAGIPVGVASDERRRYGLNAHKRTRLIKAGSDIIIPDFTRYKNLLELLNF